MPSGIQDNQGCHLLLLSQSSRMGQVVFLSHLGGGVRPFYPASNLLCSHGSHGWCNLNCPHLCVGGCGPVGPGPLNEGQHQLCQLRGLPALCKQTEVTNPSESSAGLSLRPQRQH